MNNIDEICEKYNIKNYTINDDGSIDVNGEVVLYEMDLYELPLTFNKVTDYFDCAKNNLTTLKGSPKWIGGDFFCYKNNLTSLEFGPEYVEGSFNCSNNELTNLVGSPLKIEGSFVCIFNDLTDLTGSPREVGDFFSCRHNYCLKSPKGCPEKLGEELDCFSTPLGSIFNDVDQHFLYTFNFYKIIKDDTVNLKRLKYVMNLYDQPIDLEQIEEYYRLV
jgi:hypothetical protein